MDFGFTSCCFRGSTAMMLGYQVSNSENAYDFFLGYFFFSIRPTDPILGNAFDGKRPKKRGMALALVTDVRDGVFWWLLSPP